MDAQGCEKILLESAYPNIERHYTEWSSSPSPRDPVHDTAFLTAFIVDNNWRARGLMDSLSFWVVSDIFEESRLGDTPFHGGFGLVNVQGLKKASYHGYWFLSRLGDEVLAEGDAYAVTRAPMGLLLSCCGTTATIAMTPTTAACWPPPSRAKSTICSPFSRRVNFN